MLHPAIQLLRPRQWAKNFFVLAGCLFSDTWPGVNTLAAVAAFCLLSSATYIVNDLVDLDADRQHPDKRHRPLASGAISPGLALLIAGLCAVTGLGLAFSYSQAPWIYLAYLALQAAYITFLKHVAPWDVVCISTGFMLRLLAGTTGLGIEPSQWLLLDGLLLTLCLGFAKRQAEILSPVRVRPALESYTPGVLTFFTWSAALGAGLVYGLYALATDALLTVPFVIAGLGRLLILPAGDPTEVTTRDHWLLLIGAGWLGAVLAR